MALLRRIFGTPKLAPAEKKSLKREQVNDLTVPVALAMLEGGFIGVIADKIYNVPAGVLALLASAAFIGNLSSYLWTRVSSARAKVPVVVGLQVLTMACLILVVAAPVNGVGTIMVVVGVVAARCLMAGTVTIRSVVWSLNYPSFNPGPNHRTLARIHQSGDGCYHFGCRTDSGCQSVDISMDVCRWDSYRINRNPFFFSD